MEPAGRIGKRTQRGHGDRRQETPRLLFRRPSEERQARPSVASVDPRPSAPSPGLGFRTPPSDPPRGGVRIEAARPSSSEVPAELAPSIKAPPSFRAQSGARSQGAGRASAAGGNYAEASPKQSPWWGSYVRGT